MEPASRNWAFFIGAVSLAACTAIVTYLITISGKSGCSANSLPTKDRYGGEFGLRFGPKSVYDVSNTLHIPEKKVTLIKGIGAGKCFVITDDNGQWTDRALTLLDQLISEDQLRTVGGDLAVEFCHGFPVAPARVSSDATGAFRPKREDAAAAEAQKKFKAHSNECAENVIVQCADGNQVYKCVTGPREVYRASTECKSATQFTFNLTTRCKEFKATEGDRFIKCLQKFILNQQGPGGAPPASE